MEASNSMRDKNKGEPGGRGTGIRDHVLRLLEKVAEGETSYHGREREFNWRVKNVVINKTMRNETAIQARSGLGRCQSV